MLRLISLPVRPYISDMISHIDQIVRQDHQGAGGQKSHQCRNQGRAFVGHDVFLSMIRRSGPYPGYALNRAIGKDARAREKLVAVARKAAPMVIRFNLLISILHFLGLQFRRWNDPPSGVRNRPISMAALTPVLQICYADMHS